MTRISARGLHILLAASWLGAAGARAESKPRELPAKPPAAQIAQPEAGAKSAPLAHAATRPRLEVVFVLDTTGSMAGLIDGAKRKIWSIADELASAQPTPDLRVGLIAYRDRGDAYVTQRFELTDDLDALYEHLQTLQADGGGDTPESVNQALYEAVDKTQWSSGERVYRSVFLVGDAPPHMDYGDDVPYTKTVKLAHSRGVVINTVQCGSEHRTKPIWTAIAHRTQGTFAAIQQDGGMMAIATPVDAEIARVNAELAGSVLAYGDSSERERVESKRKNAVAASAEAGAARHSYLKKKGGSVITGSGDLVDDVNSGRVKLTDVPASELPAELRAQSEPERAATLERKSKQREQLKSRLDALVEQRASYVKAEEKERAARGEADGFDAEVKKAVKAQAAAAAGVSYAE